MEAPDNMIKILLGMSTYQERDWYDSQEISQQGHPRDQQTHLCTDWFRYERASSHQERIACYNLEKHGLNSQTHSSGKTNVNINSAILSSPCT
jgi:hypothetical protein